MDGKMETRQKEVIVIGHKNPDTDSICSAIAYAAFKNRTGEVTHIAGRAGEISRETAWVLKHFGLGEPILYEDVSPQLRDAEIRCTPGVSGELTVRKAWRIMKQRDISTLPIVDGDGWLQGIITLRDMAVASMESPDPSAVSKARTPYRNIAETLDGRIVTGNPDSIMERGRVLVGAGNPEAISSAMHKDDLVLVSNRDTAQRAAITGGAGCVVVCLSAEISEDIQKLAEERNCVLISTPYDTYLAACFIGQSIPLRQNMLPVRYVKQFRLSTPLEEAMNTMSRTRHVYFPVQDDSGRYYGVISRRNMMNSSSRKLILVDHNEKAQCVTGWEKAQIMEIIDHHRVGGLQTISPIYFRNQPVGSTATIIRQLYKEHGLDIPSDLAGAMCCAILSDTLMLRSPTCTDLDREYAHELSAMAGEDMEALGEAMFEAGENLTGKTGEDLLYQDFKVFSAENRDFGIGQASFLSTANRMKAGTLVRDVLPGCLKKHNISLAYFLLTDIRSQSSYVLCAGEHAEEILREAFRLPDEEGILFLDGVVSRKKQFVPPLIATVTRWGK